MRDLPDDDEWITARHRVIGARLREARLTQNLTQDQVWQAARIDRRTLQHVEAGREVKLSTLMRIARVQDVPLDEIVR